MVTQVIAFTALFLMAWISTINIFRVICNKNLPSNRELILRIKVVDYQRGRDYNTIIAEIGDRTCNIRDINKCFYREIDSKLGGYVTVVVNVLHIGFIIMEPVLVIKEVRQGY